MSGRVILYLRVEVRSERREAFLEFLGRAFPFYEEPGGIQMRLLEDASCPNCFIEEVQYADEQTYERDQRRVESDPTMKEYLQEWRSLLATPPQVQVFREVPVASRSN